MTNHYLNQWWLSQLMYVCISYQAWMSLLRKGYISMGLYHVRLGRYHIDLFVKLEKDIFAGLMLHKSRQPIWEIYIGGSFYQHWNRWWMGVVSQNSILCDSFSRHLLHKRNLTLCCVEAEKFQNKIFSTWGNNVSEPGSLPFWLIGGFFCFLPWMESAGTLS